MIIDNKNNNTSTTCVNQCVRSHDTCGIEEIVITHKKQEQQQQHTSRRRIFVEYWKCENKYDNYQLNANVIRERHEPRRLFPTIATTFTPTYSHCLIRQRSTPTLPVTIMQRPPLKKSPQSTSSLLKSKNSQRR